MNKSLLTISIATSLILIPTVSAFEVSATAKADEVILVTGKKPEQSLDEVAGSIAVATQEQLERQLVTDMNQLFKYDPSINITGGSGEAQNFVVRGMGGDRILMIKDGMRMNEGYGANGANDIVGRGFIDMDTLKQVEVAKGAASSLYGADALGGIVLFTTKDPMDYLANDEFYSSVKTGYTSANEQANLGATFAFATGDVSHLINVSGRRGSENQNFYETKAPLDVDSNSLFYKGVYQLSAHTQAKFSADLWEQDVLGETADALAGPFRSLAKWGYIITDESKTNAKENSSYKLSFHNSDNSVLSDEFNVAFYLNNTTQKDVEYVRLDINAPMFGQVGIRDMWANYAYEQETVGVISNAVKTIEADGLSHSIGYGIDIEQSTSQRTVHNYRIQNDEVTTDETSDKFPENEITRFGLFINDSVALSDDTTLIGGLRWDSYDMKPQNGAEAEVIYSDLSEQQLSPNLGLIYQHSDGLSSYVQYARGFKVPAYDLAYLNHDNSIYGYKVVPSDDLSPEKSDSFEIGLRGEFGDFSVSSAVFYNEYEDFINIKLLDIVDDVAIQQYQNLDQVTIKGAELNLTYFINEEMSVFANTAYQDGKDRNTDRYISEISPLSGTLGMGYQQDNWGGDILLRWSDDMRKVNEGEVKTAGYGAVDFNAFYQVNDKLTFNAAVTNLTDRKFTNFSSVAGTHKEGLNEDEANYRLSAGRQFSVSARYSF